MKQPLPTPGDSPHREPTLSVDAKNLLDAIPFPAMLIDGTHTILMANRTLSEALELPRNRIEGKKCFEVMYGTSEPIAECPLTDALENGPPSEKEILHPQTNRWTSLGVYWTGSSTEDGREIYLHCIRDVDLFHQTTSDLSQSLEHHKAIGELLQRLQKCQSSVQIMEVLLDQVLSISWLGVEATAAAFLLKDGRLEMMAHRNLNEAQRARCKCLELGECLCGRVAQTGEKVMCASDSAHHHITFEDMQHHEHAILPLSYEDRVLGVLNLYLSKGNLLDRFRIDFL